MSWNRCHMATKNGRCERNAVRGERYCAICKGRAKMTYKTHWNPTRRIGGTDPIRYLGEG